MSAEHRRQRKTEPVPPWRAEEPLAELTDRRIPRIELRLHGVGQRHAVVLRELSVLLRGVEARVRAWHDVQHLVVIKCHVCAQDTRDLFVRCSKPLGDKRAKNKAKKRV